MDTLGYLADLSIQVGLLCLLVLATITALHIRSPLIRHRLWISVALSPILFLLLDLLVPTIRISLPHLNNPSAPSLITESNDPIPQSESFPSPLSPSSLDSQNVNTSYDTRVGEPKPVKILRDNSPSTSPSVTAQGKARQVPYQTILLIIWIVGCSLMLLRLSRRLIALHRLSRSLSEVTDGKLPEKLRRLMAAMSVRGNVGLFSSDAFPSPFSYGVLRPRIVLPRRYLDGSHEKLEMILIHELGHIRRYDYLVSLICGALSAIFFFHPLYLYALRRLAGACEHLSDEWVVKLTERRGDYARCLIEALEERFSPQATLPFSISGGLRGFERRVEMIMDTKRKIRVNLSWGLRMVLFSFIILSLSGLSTLKLTGASESEEGLIHRWDGPEAAFEKTFGGKEEDRGSSIVRTSDGGFVIVGSTHPKIVRPKTEITLRRNAWLIKVNDKGKVIWQRTFGGNITSSDITWGNSIQQTCDGGFIIVGGRNISGSSRTSVYLVKTDGDGKLEWERTFKSLSRGTSIQQTSDGGYIITGSLISGSDMQVYLLKTDDKGNKLWWKAFGGDDLDRGTSVQQTSDGGFIIVGVTRSFSKFPSLGKEDVYLIKTDGEGNLEWQKSFGGRRDDGGNSVLQTPDGGYIIAGYTRSLGAGETDIYLIKTDGEGNLKWQRAFGGKGKDYGKSICQTSDGGYVIVGETESFGSGKVDVYLIKTDGEGNLEWQKTFGGEGEDYGCSVQQLPDGGFIVVGATNSLGAGGYDVYLIRTQPPPKPSRGSGGIRSAPFKNRKALAQSRKPDRGCYGVAVYVIRVSGVKEMTDLPIRSGLKPPFVRWPLEHLSSEAARSAESAAREILRVLPKAKVEILLDERVNLYPGRRCWEFNGAGEVPILGRFLKFILNDSPAQPSVIKFMDDSRERYIGFSVNDHAKGVQLCYGMSDDLNKVLDADRLGTKVNYAKFNQGSGGIHWSEGNRTYFGELMNVTLIKPDEDNITLKPGEMLDLSKPPIMRIRSALPSSIKAAEASRGSPVRRSIHMPPDLSTVADQVKSLEYQILVLESSLGRPAPDFSLKDLKGETFTLSSMRGRVVMLDFWSTVCGPCVREIPELKSLYERFRGSSDFILVGISLDIDKEKVARFVRDKGMNWRQLIDTKDVSGKYGVRSIPRYIIIDKNGMIRYRGRDFMEIETLISELLKGKGKTIEGKYAEIHRLRGNLYWIKGEEEKALAEYEKALQIQPDDVGLCVKVAKIHESRGDTKRGKEFLEKAFEGIIRLVKAKGPASRDTRLGDNAFWVACAFSRYGDKRRCLEAFKIAVRINPNYKTVAKRNDTMFRIIRDTKEFQKLIADAPEIKLTKEQLERAKKEDKKISALSFRLPRIRKSFVLLDNGEKRFTGVVLDRSGYILTVSEALKGKSVWIRSGDIKFPVRVVAEDDRLKIAVLKLDGFKYLCPVEIRELETLRKEEDNETLCVIKSKDVGFSTTFYQALYVFRDSDGSIRFLLTLGEAYKADTYERIKLISPGDAILDLDGRLIGICGSERVLLGEDLGHYKVLPTSLVMERLREIGIADKLVRGSPPKPDKPFEYAVEAEGFTRIGGEKPPYEPFLKKEVESASNGVCLVTNPEGKVYDEAKACWLVYEVEIPRDGDYVLWARVRSHGGKSDSLFVATDLSPEPEVWDAKSHERWSWLPVITRETLEEVRVYHLTKGRHEIRIFPRERGTEIDALYLTNRFDMTPDQVERSFKSLQLQSGSEP
jgi:beta-lactamase regulating signal transducer with metallopeptidase domain/peroxiredoxin